MPLVTLESPGIEIDIPDFIEGKTEIMRTATLFTMIYNQQEKQLVLNWTVKHFAKNEDGSKGEYLKIISDWSKESVADNTTMCDMTNGHPIEKTYNTGEKDADGNPIMDYDPAINYTGQYDFFYYLAQNSPIQVHPVIRNFGVMVRTWEKR